jgi:dTMP kinase
MKKWMYLVVPGILLAAFLVLYNQEMTQIGVREQAHKAEVAKAKADEDAKKQQAEQEAKISADKRAKEQKDTEEKVTAEKEAKWQGESKKIQDQTDQNSTEADNLSKKAAELEIELDSLNQKKEKDNQEDFDLLKQVQLARVAQENADMQIQRKVEMIASKADESAMTEMPPPPPEKK